MIREDPYNRDLLFVGTSRACTRRSTAAQSWQRFMTGMPTVPVHDLKIHPRDRELIAATHGRGIWIVDIAPLEQLAGDNGTKVVADAGLSLPAEDGVRVRPGSGDGCVGERRRPQGLQRAEPGVRRGDRVSRRTAVRWRTRRRPATTMAATAPAPVARRLTRRAARGQGQRGQRGPQAQILITNAKGDTVRTLTGPAAAGLHRVTWDFRGRAAPRARALAIAAARQRDRGAAHDVRVRLARESGDDAEARARSNPSDDGER